jgi:hypothetical protein
MYLSDVSWSKQEEAVLLRHVALFYEHFQNHSKQIGISVQTECLNNSQIKTDSIVTVWNSILYHVDRQTYFYVSRYVL